MKVRDLIVALTKVDPDAEAAVYQGEDTTAPIVGVDPYEGAAVLVVGDES